MDVPLVLEHLVLAVEGFLAAVTLIWFHLIVPPQVVVPIAACGKGLLTSFEITGVKLLALVHSNVLVEISVLLESF